MLCLFALDLRKIKTFGLCLALSQWAVAALLYVIEHFSMAEVVILLCHCTGDSESPSPSQNAEGNNSN